MKPLVLALAIIATGGAAVGGQKLSQPIVVNSFCGTGCPIDALKKGKFNLLPTDARGADGLKGKVTLSGVSLGGVPVDVASVQAFIGLSFNRGSCQFFESPPFDIVEGRGVVTFTGSETTPGPIGEAWAPGTTVQLCDFNLFLDSGTILAVGGFNLGSDSD